MNRDQQSQYESLRLRHKRRLQILEEKRATLGINTPPEIITEIEDIEEQISEIDSIIGNEQGNIIAKAKVLRRFPSNLLLIGGLGVLISGFLIVIAIRLISSSDTTIQPAILLLSESKDYSNLEITIRNPSEREVLAKKISVLLKIDNPFACVSSPYRFSYTISDTLTVTNIDGKNISLKGNVTDGNRSGFVYPVGGEVTIGCPTDDLSLNFDTSFILPPGQYTSISVLVPKHLRSITKEKEKFLSWRDTVKYNSATVSIWVDTQDNPISLTVK